MIIDVFLQIVNCLSDAVKPVAQQLMTDVTTDGTLYVSAGLCEAAKAAVMQGILRRKNKLQRFILNNHRAGLSVLTEALFKRLLCINPAQVSTFRVQTASARTLRPTIMQVRFSNKRDKLRMFLL